MTTPSPTPPVPAAGIQPSGDPGTTPPTNQPAPPAPASGNTLSLSQAELDARIAAARREADAKASAAQAELDKLKAERMTESEKAIADAQKKAREDADKEWAPKLLQTEIRARLAAKGYPAEWAAHVQAENVEGIDAAITKCETMPWFKPVTAPPLGPIVSGGAAGPPAPKTITRSQSLDPDFYAANKENVTKALFQRDGWRIVEG